MENRERRKEKREEMVESDRSGQDVGICGWGIELGRFSHGTGMGGYTVLARYGIDST